MGSYKPTYNRGGTILYSDLNSYMAEKLDVYGNVMEINIGKYLGKL